jgi:ectoine hydroxylase-related dioxygenase (phytanoyl-CoA dioxygenase family)
VAVPGLLDEDLRTRLCSDLEYAYDICTKIRTRNGLDENADGSLHHILGLRPSFMEFLERQYLHREIEEFFAGKYILNSFGGVVNRQSIVSYLHRVHRDVRTFLPGAKLLINMLVALDDFTKRNGATYLLSGSHLHPECPADETFFKEADRLIVKAGTIVLFDSNLWHSAGKNTDGSPRRALTLNFSRPFVKQQLDYPAYLGSAYRYSLTESMRQVLGYNALQPKSLDEWYQPPEKRSYRRDQE